MSNLSELTTINSFQDLLQSLNSTSKVSVSDLLLYNVAYSEFLLENNIVNLYNQLEELLNRTGYGQAQWLIDKALEFQSSDILLLNPDTYELYYSTINTDKQVVGYAAALETDTGVLLKIRGKNSDLLNSEELTQFSDFISKIKIMGQRISILNIPADSLKLVGEITYSAQLSLATIQSNVETAINNYIENLEFNSTFIKSQLIEDIMVLNGIKNVTFSTMEAKSYSSGYVSITDTYEAVSGYLKIDPAFPLSSNLTYKISK